MKHFLYLAYFFNLPKGLSIAFSHRRRVVLGIVSHFNFAIVRQNVVRNLWTPKNCYKNLIIAKWYLGKSVDNLAIQVKLCTKYMYTKRLLRKYPIRAKWYLKVLIN